MNNKQTIIENDCAFLWYYPDSKIVHHKFIQPVSGESFRTVLMTGLKLLQEHGAQKWLSDDRNNSILSAEDSAWGFEYWEPLAIKAGWKYWAMLMPIKARGRINMQRQIKHVEIFKQVTTKQFSEPDEAWQWLKRQGTTEDRE